VDKSKRNRKVTEELKRIPQGSVYQNKLRADYHNMRRRDLSRNPALSAKEILLRTIKIVREEEPDFLPMYDKDFFSA